MDESFSSTSGLEAGYIASEVLTGIGVIGCCGLFVTHIHDLPMKVQEYNSYPGNRSKIDNLVAQMDNVAQGVQKLSDQSDDTGWTQLCQRYCIAVWSESGRNLRE